MKYGTHNSLTYAKLIWWQRPFAWLINPFSRCQDKDITTQVKNDVVAFDIQMAQYKDKWKASHGIAWYDVDIIPMLEYLNKLAGNLNERFYVRIGLDRHFFRTKKRHEKEREAFHDFVEIYLKSYHNLKLIELYVEYPEYKTLFFGFISGLEQIYWSLAFARAKARQARGLERYLYYLPVPRLWARKYRNAWEAMAILRNKEIFMTDFI